ncbi:Uncharacterised protein [Mycolicibacterium phlei]|jgi:hypothetical protein|uniref:Uncharacterized protein n=1 Tax=Mycolicibacterium phlei DSM 43239 = CCUG 21000 TaxID=1226750 RepID=A0A5N5UTV9_MYCPH|nr:hypothetical protein [Mycolicibacterium phlei]VEG09365.1 Uncharacterised protein [Mycobacteroides chelonae]AMO61252.1 hypothetical protein MPHLCCUG_02440 [Mycolicibacterium phlei]KAB7752507.1 hypothetical protein MPHL21000_21300 [Mycolicibacterium phlei DSM 43239 = CCUG 21000]KXW60855.1 hypothetical protein MPHL43239_23075 [Mycolicibacterium phlei DSM 43239 = CCUG 21000]KXW76295.1 hypothetical protein JL15_17605 [Mycolicibacterium phlei DSM 43071]
MTDPDGRTFGAADIPEADAADQRTPVNPDDEDDVFGGVAQIPADRTWEANEADLIEQAIEVPIPEDDDLALD